MNTRNWSDDKKKVIILIVSALFVLSVGLPIRWFVPHRPSQSSFRCYSIVDSLSNESRADFDSMERLMRDSMRLHEVEFATRYMHVQKRKAQRSHDLDSLLSVCRD